MHGATAIINHGLSWSEHKLRPSRSRSPLGVLFHLLRRVASSLTFVWSTCTLYVVGVFWCLMYDTHDTLAHTWAHTHGIGTGPVPWQRPVPVAALDVKMLSKMLRENTKLRSTDEKCPGARPH